jgi:hypothetical protein
VLLAVPLTTNTTHSQDVIEVLQDVWEDEDFF